MDMINGAGEQRKMRNLRKYVFFQARRCLRLGWLLRRGMIADEPGLSQSFLLEQGQEIARRARALLPGGVLVSEGDIRAAAVTTAGLLRDPACEAIFRGAFSAGGYTARAGILRRNGDGWHLTEVKSSVNDRDSFVQDLAFTTMVLLMSGVNVVRVSLLLLSREYRAGMGDDKLFVEVEHTADVLGQLMDYAPRWREIEEATRAPEPPAPRLISRCRECAAFRECAGAGIENHIFDLPALRPDTFKELTDRGIARIEDIPEDIELTVSQRDMRTCILTGRPRVSKGLRRALDKVAWPAYYLDFETVATPLPLYPGFEPFASIPTQFSIHACAKPGEVTGHFEYIADHTRECRREIAERLLAVLGSEGSIIIYSDYEKRIMRELAALYPDLAPALNALCARVVDLEPVIREHYLHPGFRGKTSIKKVLPVLVPEMDYGGLAISNGFDAHTTFAMLATGKYRDAEVPEVRRQLFEYCRQDTLAMVKLHESLVRAAEGDGEAHPVRREHTFAPVDDAARG